MAAGNISAMQLEKEANRHEPLVPATLRNNNQPSCHRPQKTGDAPQRVKTFCQAELVDTTIIGNASQKGKTKQLLTDITNRLNFPRFSSTPIKSCGQVSSSYSQEQYPKSMQEHNLRYGLSSSNLQKEHLLPDLNKIPLFQEFEDDNIDADIPGHMQSNVQIHDENEDDGVFEDDEVESLMTNEEYWDIGDANYECEYCGAYFWFEERVDKKYKNKKTSFHFVLWSWKNQATKSKGASFDFEEFIVWIRENIRTYNSIFAFTSMGGNVDFSINKTKGPRTFRLSGQNYHQIGSLLPLEGSSPKFAQLYIYDTENEVENRIHAICRGEMNNQLHAEIVNELKQMLDDNNVLAKLRLIGKRGSDGRRYNLPTVSEVAALIVGDFEQRRSDRDIIVESQSGQLRRINELNVSYLGLQYPLLFPYGEDGYREDIPLNDIDDSTGGRKYVSTREYLSYKIQEWKDEDPTIVSAELPDKKVDPYYYYAVTNFMMHGPCGTARKSSPCMQNGRCTKHFPKKFVSSTTIDEDGYPIYRRRDDGRTAKRTVIFSDDDPIDAVVNRPTVKESMFLSWFEANKTFPKSRELIYAELPLKFVWKQNLKRWEKRRTSAFSIGRIFFVPPGSGEQYYLGLLLDVIKDDDKEYVDAIMEASNWRMTSYLRQLFAMLLLSNSMSCPKSVWQATCHLLSEDILHEERRILDHPEADLTDEELKNRCLQKLEIFLKGCGRSFQDFPTMPRPVYNTEEVDNSNRLIRDELHYNKRIWQRNINN
ncbi:uncharacterized protein LOC142174626 [Nicotiana tabacum]|uniref:Uncharacterized protein LOC142174626 n=1 Tax=Nicotiana tabacum TaxID=4097 RepID=A0AC58TH71_TOBAC